MRRALFIANRFAGGDTRVADAAVESARAAGWEASAVWSEIRGHAVLLSEEAALRGTELVVSVGGDGTAREVAAGLSGTDSVMGFVPAGTGNSSFRELFGTRSWQDVLSAALQDLRWRAVDLGRVDPTGEVSLLGFSVGWFAQVIAIARTHEELSGAGKYMVAALEAVANPVAFEATVTVDGRRLASGSLGLVAVGGARVRAAVFPVLPGSLIDDGLLDVVVFEHAPADEFRARLERVQAGTHLESAGVFAGRGSSIEIASGMPLPAEVDGDAWERDVASCTVTAMPGALRVTAVPN